MFFISLARIIKFSLQDIGRNIWLSLVTVIILVLTLFSVNLLVTVRAISDAAITSIKNKVDVNLYLESEASEDRILALKSRVSLLDNVEKVDYITKEEALARFEKTHQNDPQIIEALSELNRNPLTPSLVITPKSTDDFDALINELNKIESPIIESRNFDNHRDMLTKINTITDRVSEAGFAVSAIFIFITLLVIYNTVKVAIYTHKGEIGIMRLVGASHWFIKAPFLVSSLIYTVVSMIIVVALFYLFLNLLQPYLETFFMGYQFNIISYFNIHFLQIFGGQLLIAALVNVLASLIAVGKYAHV